MSKSLKSYPESKRRAVAERRADGEGLGALAAQDFLDKPKVEEQAQATGQAQTGETHG